MTKAVELTLIVLIMALPMCLQANPAPTLADLHWMQGSWQGQVGGTEDSPQILEETWSKAAAGTQLAMVRMRTAKQTIFAELITMSLTYTRKEDNFTIQVMLTEGNQFVAELSAVGDI